jgi:hypothetical protein
MAKPLRKTCSKRHPYVVERHDQEDGSIHYEIWDERQETYHRLCTVAEDPCEFDEPSPDRGRAKRDADMIVKALNLRHGLMTDEDRARAGER